MVGNDVVDLGDPEVQPERRHPRFDARVFTSAERRCLTGSAEAERLRWALWAAKESAFKALLRLAPGTPFSPRAFAADLASVPGGLQGRVTRGGCSFTVRVAIHGAALHAVALAAGVGAERLVVGLRALGADEARRAGASASAAVRHLARGLFARRLHLEPARLAVERAGRLPRLLVEGMEAPVALSLSHHGRFVACAGLLFPEAGE